MTNQEIVKKFLLTDNYKRNLIYSEQYHCFFLFNDKYYENIDPQKFREIVYKHLLTNYEKNITENLIANVISQIKYMAIKEENYESDNLISLKDGLYNVEKGKLLKHNPDYFTTFFIPYTYDEIFNSKAPTFKKFLESSLVNIDNNKETDYSLIQLIKEMIGYFFLGKNTANCFFFVGDGSNGKSKLCDVIRTLFGNSKFCSSMAIERLTTRPFSIPHLIGKRLNISHEEESKYMRSDTFKALISGDSVTGEYKGGDTFDFQPRTKFLFASNQLPTFDYINKGLIRRINIIPFYRIFNKKDDDFDLDIGEKLSFELPGIVKFGFEGALELINNKYIFTESEASMASLREFENEISSSLRFIRENYDVSDQGYISNRDLYEHYRNWCLETGKKPLNLFNFIKDLKNIDGIRFERSNDRNTRGKNLILKNDNLINNINF